MINNTKFILLQLILFVMFPVSSLGQNEYAIKQKIIDSLKEFMCYVGYVNDEEGVMTPSMIAARFGNVNYFQCNGKEKKLQTFIEDYCYFDLKRQNITHTLNISHSNIKKFSDDPSDQRWSANGVLKRENASNIQDTIPDEIISFTILWRGMNEEIGLLEIDFQGKPLIIDEVGGSQENEGKNHRMGNNVRYPFSARVFVPGMAQLHKGSTFKGATFIAAEAIAVGGIVIFEGLRSSYKTKINTTHDVQDRQNYIDKTNNMQNLRNGFIAGALAVYAWNVIDGIVAKGKKHVELGRVELRFAPFATPEAGGLAMNIQF